MAQRLREGFTWEWNPQPNNPEHVRIVDGWVGRNIVTVEWPDVVPGRKIRLNRRAVKPFRAWFDDLERNGLLAYLGPFNGCWVARFKRQTGTLVQRRAKCILLARDRRTDALSNHAWGLAMDFNAEAYPLGYRPPADDPRHELARLARPHGIECGINYHSRPDGMHFELVSERPLPPRP